MFYTEIGKRGPDWDQVAWCDGTALTARRKHTHTRLRLAARERTRPGTERPPGGCWRKWHSAASAWAKEQWGVVNKINAKWFWKMLQRSSSWYLFFNLLRDESYMCKPSICISCVSTSNLIRSNAEENGNMPKSFWSFVLLSFGGACLSVSHFFCSFYTINPVCLFFI